MEILGIGPMELVLILIVALMVFGPDKLPQIGAKLGRGMREMRKATRAISEEVNATRDAVTGQAKELTDPFQDITDAAKAAGGIVAAAKNPTQTIKDSFMKELNRTAEEPSAAAEPAEQNTIAPPQAVAAAALTPTAEAPAPAALPQPEDTRALPAPAETAALPQPDEVLALPSPEPPAVELLPPPAEPESPAISAPAETDLPASDQPVPKKRKPRAKKPSEPTGAEPAAGEQ